MPMFVVDRHDIHAITCRLIQLDTMLTNDAERIDMDCST
jgi:hypothetical protein